MKKKLIYILLIVGFCVSLFFLLISSEENNSANGFRRNLINPKMKLTAVYKFPDHLFGFLWEPNDDIWILDYKNPLTLLKMDYSLKHIEKIKTKMPAGFDTSSRFLYFDRLDSNIYATNQSGDIGVLSKKNSENYKTNSLNFDAVIPISSHSAIIRNFVHKDTGDHTELTKITLVDKKIVTGKKYILPKQVDGFFCSDGSIHYDQLNSRFFYMYYHRGEFLCLDTNLNLLYKAKTIDTVHNAKIKLGKFSTTPWQSKDLKGTTMITPPSLVNKYMTVEKELVYIYSGLRADNETKGTALKNEPIDVYSLKDGKYIHSFHLPRYNGYKLRQFKVKGNVIIAIFRDYIVTFSFR